MKNVKANPSASLRRRYISGLIAIAFIGLASLIFSNMFVSGSEDFGRVINIAGRQRMLSQKIVKEALLMDDCSDSTIIDKKGERLKETLSVFESSNNALIKRDGSMDIYGKNSAEVTELFETIKPSYNHLVDSVKAILETASKAKVDTARINTLQRGILKNQAEFLKYMDEITFQYDFEAKAKVGQIKTIQWILYGVLMLSLLFVFLFIFFPFDKYLNEYFAKLDTSMIILKEQATFDEITGVYNKKSGLILLNQIFDRSKRDGKFFTKMFSDLDGLKAVNDKLGHLEGDEFIKSYAAILKKNLRPYDFCMRYGGDEFITIITSPEPVARSIIRRIENSIFDFNSFTVKEWKIFHSYGIEEFSPKSAYTLEQLLESADKKMYEAKRVKAALKA